MKPSLSHNGGKSRAFLQLRREDEQLLPVNELMRNAIEAPLILIYQNYLRPANSSRVTDSMIEFNPLKLASDSGTCRLSDFAHHSRGRDVLPNLHIRFRK